MAERVESGNGYRDNGHGSTAVTERPGTGRIETRDIGEIVSTLTEDASELISTHMRLVVVEAREEVKATVDTAKFFAGFASCMYMTVILASFAAAWGLAVIMPAGFAFLIIASLYAATGAVLFLRGHRASQEIELPPPETTKSIEEDVAWLQQQRT